MNQASVGTPLLWLGFTGFVLAMLALDLGVFHRKAHEVRVREALTWSAVWVSLALGFNGLIYRWFGADRALEFLAGYLIEKALSVDNLFVFLIIFSYFAVPRALQHRVLFWGIASAIVMRVAFILAGAELLARFHFVMYVFGAFLVYTGVKLAVQRRAAVDPVRNPMLRLVRRVVPAVAGYRGARFTVVEGGRRYATPLLVVLLVIEATDVLFAVDSIPAVFGVTRDPFIVYTSNIFAILGLRSLYFALAGMMLRFHYLKVGIGLVLAFVGVKMLIADVYELPIAASLSVIVGLLASAVAISVLRPEVVVGGPGFGHETEAEPETEPGPEAETETETEPEPARSRGFRGRFGAPMLALRRASERHGRDSRSRR